MIPSRTFYDQVGMTEFRLEGGFEIDVTRQVIRFDVLDRNSGSFSFLSFPMIPSFNSLLT